MKLTQTAALSLLLAGGLLGVGSVASAMQAPSPIVPPTTTTTTTVLFTGTDQDFLAAFAVQAGDDMASVSSYVSLTNQSTEDFDLSGAATWAQMAADGFGDLRTLSDGLPGVESNYGTTVRRMLAVCQLAWQHSADALDAFDIAEVGDTALLELCNAAMSDVTDLTHDLTDGV